MLINPQPSLDEGYQTQVIESADLVQELERCNKTRTQLHHLIFPMDRYIAPAEIYPNFKKVVNKYLSEVTEQDQNKQDFSSFDQLLENIKILTQRDVSVESELLSHTGDGNQIFLNYNGILNEIMFLATDVYAVANNTSAFLLTEENVEQITLVKTSCGDKIDSFTAPFMTKRKDYVEGVLRVIDQQLTHQPRHNFKERKRS